MRLKSESCGNAGKRLARPFAGALAGALLAASAPSCSFESGGIPAPDSRPSLEKAADFRQDMKQDSARNKSLSDLAPDRKLHDLPVADKAVPDTAKADSFHDTFVADKPAPDSTPSCPQVSTGTYSGMIYPGNPKLVGGYTFDYKGIDAATDALFDISCGASAVFIGMAFPQNLMTPIEIPAHSRRIRMTPQSANATQVKINIVVENL